MHVLVHILILPNHNILFLTLSRASEGGDGKKIIKLDGDKFIDSHGGFLINQRDKDEEEQAREAKMAKLDDGTDLPVNFKECLECNLDFIDSYLLKNFGLETCDECK